MPIHSDFTIHNLPFGIFSTAQQPQPRVGVAYGDQIIDMVVAANTALFDSFLPETQKLVFGQPTLNEFIRLGRPIWQAVRQVLQHELADHQSRLHSVAEQILVPQAEATMHCYPTGVTCRWRITAGPRRWWCRERIFVDPAVR